MKATFFNLTMFVSAAFLLAVAIVPTSAGEPQQRSAQTPPPPGAETLNSSKEALASVAWLTGHWSGTSGPMSFEEHWTGSADGTMIGMFRLTSGGQFVLSEHLTIEAEEDKIVMRILHFGRKMEAQEEAPLVAVAEEVTETKAVFASPEEAEPLRVTYELDGDKLNVTVETTHDGQPATFALPFERVKGD